MKFTGRIKECTQNFSILENDISDEECDRYYQNWMQKYSSFFKEETEKKSLYMNCRVIRSRKEVVSAAQLLMEAKSNRESGCPTSYFFSCYYALFHAMLAVLYTNTEVGDDITEITHSKLLNVFCDYYAKNNLIFNSSLKEYVEKAKERREYYSYTIPYNVLFGDFDEEELELLIKKMILLADLHVWMLSKKSLHIQLRDDNKEEVFKEFLKFNVRKKNGDFSDTVKGYTGELGNIIRKYGAEPDAADYDALIEIEKYGINCQLFEMELSHDWDEMGYSNLMEPLFEEKNVYSVKSKANSFLYELLSYYG